jgi:hypothetical protein
VVAVEPDVVVVAVGLVVVVAVAVVVVVDSTVVEVAGVEVVVAANVVVVATVPAFPPQAATRRPRVARPSAVRLIPMRRSNVGFWVTVPPGTN